MAEASLRKRRGVVRASITKLSGRVKDLEAKTDQESTLDLAQQTQQRLERLDAEFKEHHYGLIDAINGEEALRREQDTLDEHDDTLSGLSLRIQQLITACTSSSPSSPHHTASKRLIRMKKALSSINSAIEKLGTDADSVCLLHQHQEQLADIKREIGDINSSLLSLNLADGDKLTLLQTEVEQAIFNCSLNVKKALRSRDGEPSAVDGKGVRLPKLEVPTFDGDILNWKAFWEQFSISVHNRPNLSDSEKLVYLQHALKAGSAKHMAKSEGPSI